MIYHFVVGDEAAKPLLEALSADGGSQDSVVVLKDILHVGPLLKEEGQKFSAMRSAFWQEVTPQMKEPVQVDDLERLLQVSSDMYKSTDVKAWFWMAPGPADITAYYWVLSYLHKHRERFYVVNVGGLPFLDANGKLFYPKNISEISPRELTKARKLARVITPSEMEVDADEWEKIKNENAAIRTYEGGKKLAHKDVTYYDQQLISFCSQQFQKASKIIRQAWSKYAIPTGDTYLAWRLRELAKTGVLMIQGDATKPLNEWDVKLVGTVEETQTAESTLSDPANTNPS
ncbi:MAG TPA: DUF3658 domain-containing protein [Flavipsychrobacter sp.]|nr:DUF3658 domain-containing protein [Flavipsychrobacter sp.]